MNTKDLAQALRQADVYQDVLLESADRLEEQEKELNGLRDIKIDQRNENN